MSTTGENEMGLRKILDITRFASLFILFLHFYYFCYAFFSHLNIRSDITDRVIFNIGNTGLFANFDRSKWMALGLLAISLLGANGKKSEKLNPKQIILLIAIGFTLYFTSDLLFKWLSDTQNLAIWYFILTSAGYVCVLTGGTLLSRLIHEKLDQDIFNEYNETFPQEERLIDNEYSVNFKARYRLKGKWRNSYINFINNFRGLIVVGLPGAGKTWFILLPLIKQMIGKGYTLFIYDFKYGDLTIPAYNWMFANKHKYKIPPSFYTINFDNLSYSHRCNPLDPESMEDISDAAEAARTVLIGLNRSWIKKQGDFFIESAINFLTSIIWYLRKYGSGSFCTLPHAIEMMQWDYEKLFAVLNTEPEVQAYINDFIKAFEDDVMETLSSQIASAKVAVARLSSPKLYWVLTGSDFTLDINNPEHPKIVCIGNNPERQGIYGAAISLCASRMVKVVNKKGKLKCGLIFEEFPTLYFNNIDSQALAVGRSNLLATILCTQNFNQLTKDYGKEQADVIVNICANIISGQVFGESAKILSERFGKITQAKQSLSINRNDTSISKSTQLDYAIPASKIGSLSSGEFVGMVADEPDNKIKLKMFHAELIHDSKAASEEIRSFKDLPLVREVSEQQVADNYYQVKFDIQSLIEQEVHKLEMQKEEIDDFE